MCCARNCNSNAGFMAEILHKYYEVHKGLNEPTGTKWHCKDNDFLKFLPPYHLFHWSTNRKTRLKPAQIFGKSVYELLSYIVPVQ